MKNVYNLTQIVDEVKNHWDICVAKEFGKYIEEQNDYLGTIPRWYDGGGRVGSLLSIVDWSAVRSL